MALPMHHAYASHAPTSGNATVLEYGLLSDAQDSIEASLQAQASAPCTSAVNDDGTTLRTYRQYRQHESFMLQQSQRQLAQQCARMVSIVRSAQRDALLAHDGFGSNPDGSTHHSSPLGVEKAREGYTRALQEARQSLHQWWSPLLAEEAAISQEGRFEACAEALGKRSRSTVAVGASAQTNQQGDLCAARRSVVPIASGPSAAASTQAAVATSSPAAPGIADGHARLQQLKQEADVVNAEYYSFLSQHGGVTLGWPDDLHDRFLQAVLRAQSAVRQTQPTVGEPTDSLHGFSRLPFADVREMAQEKLSQFVQPRDIDHHVELYLRYVRLVEARKHLIDAYHLEKKEVEAGKQHIRQWRSALEAASTATSAREKESARLQRQAKLKKRLEVWRGQRERDRLETLHKAEEVDEKTRTARKHAEHKRQMDVIQRREAALEELGHERMEAVEVQKRERNLRREAAALNRQALQERWTKDLAWTQRRRDQLTAHHEAERRTSMRALEAPRLQPTSSALVSRTPRYLDPTANSVLRIVEGSQPSDVNPEGLSADPRVQWMDPAFVRQCDSTAKIHSVLYRPHTHAPAWCGVGFQR